MLNERIIIKHFFYFFLTLFAYAQITLKSIINSLKPLALTTTYFPF